MTARSFAFATSDGVTLRGEMLGPVHAPLVVLLHGGGQTRHSWKREAQSLAKRGYQTLSYDARGHGESSWSERGDYSVPALARDLEDVLRTLDGPRALVGASMGGITSFFAVGGLLCSAEAIVLVDIAPKVQRAGAERILNFMRSNNAGFATLEEAASAVAAYNPHRPPPKNPANLIHNLRQRDGRLHWHWDPRLIEGIDPSHLPSHRKEMAAVAANVRVPTLLVRGGQSDLVDPTAADDLHELMPHLDVFTVPGAGHMVVGDDNSTFHDGIWPFLAKHLPLA